MQEIHKQFSVSCFNECWDLIEKTERSAAETETMVLLARASLWHWRQREDCAPVNLSVGCWQIARVHALAGHYDTARAFAERSFDLAEGNQLAAFCRAYACEALARAELLHGDFQDARTWLTRAQDLLAEVEDPEEADLLAADLSGLAEALGSSERPDTNLG